MPARFWTGAGGTERMLVTYQRQDMEGDSISSEIQKSQEECFSRSLTA